MHCTVHWTVSAMSCTIYFAERLLTLLWKCIQFRGPKSYIGIGRRHISMHAWQVFFWRIVIAKSGFSIPFCLFLTFVRCARLISRKCPSHHKLLHQKCIAAGPWLFCAAPLKNSGLMMKIMILPKFPFGKWQKFNFAPFPIVMSDVS